MQVHSIVHKTTFDKILKAMKISKKASVLLVILSLHSKDHLSSHSHLSTSQKSVELRGAVPHMYMPSFRRYKR